MKCSSNPISEHQEVPLADNGRWEDIVARWSRHGHREHSDDGKNRCFVVSVGESNAASSRSAQLLEILALVRAQGDHVVGSTVCQLVRPDARTLLGRGTYEAIVEQAEDCAADLLVIDAELTPSQARNLEDATGFAICDREAVILNVFLRHAKTRRAKIQVEIAQLEYLRPRIRGLGLVMDQQAGGVMRARGPGETASELMARRLDDRLQELRKAAAKLRRTGDVQRKGRSACKRIALVGYTNAGKTTLMNALTAAGLSARDMPFETLDTTSRSLCRHGDHVLLSDTVGFIRRLPPRLLASFESTLAELREASLLVVVVDSADPEWELHLSTTEEQLHKLGASNTARFYVFNKADRAQSIPSEEQASALGHPWMRICSHDADAVGRLKTTLLTMVRGSQRLTRVFVPYVAADAMAIVYAKCRVVATDPRDHGVRFTLEADPQIVMQIQRATKEVRS